MVDPKAPWEVCGASSPLPPPYMSSLSRIPSAFRHLPPLVTSLAVALALGACAPEDGADSPADRAADPGASSHADPARTDGVAGPASQPGGATLGTSHAADVAPLIARQVADLAEPASSALIESLGSNLMAAIDRDGAVGAVRFCNVEAMPLRRQIEEEAGLSIKRTSWRVRNPANAPDALDQTALDHFAAATGAPQPWVQSDGGGGYLFYRPLPTGGVCLNCHGAPDQLAEGIPEVLRELYPDDRAVGFSEGELRGLLRVSVPRDALAGAGEGPD